MAQTPRSQDEINKIHEVIYVLQDKVDHLERKNGALVHIIRGMKRYKLLGELTNEKNIKDIIESAEIHIKREVEKILEQEA